MNHDASNEPTDSAPQPPSPDEIQRKLQEFMREQYGDRVQVAAVTQPENIQTGEMGEETKRRRKRAFEFGYKPKDIKAYLDRFVIKQDDAKKVLSIAVCDHYNHVKQCASEHSEKCLDYAKQNVLLLGPTGVGKTYLIRCVADLIGVPFVKADATKFSETGYVGGDVEDLVRELVHRADGDVKLAEYGIIYIDEVDKISSMPNASGRDVSGRGVQSNLLKLMEETEVPRRSQMDLQGQLQAAMEFQRSGKSKREVINTRHILFIVSGAFDRLDDIVRRRLRETSIGFAAKPARDLTESDLLRQTTTRDLIDFGFEPEFVGRLPVRVVCDPLGVDDLFHILKNSEGSVVRQYVKAFEAFGIEIMFADDGLRAIAEQAAKEHTGARALMTVCERVLRDFKFELPSAHVKRFALTRVVVENPRAQLQRILDEPSHEDAAVSLQLVREFATQFSAAHGLKIRFTDEAAAALARRAATDNKPVRLLCAELFKDYEFGLKLIKKNTGTSEFELPLDAVNAPDKFLSEWVVAVYRQNEKAE